LQGRNPNSLKDAKMPSVMLHALLSSASGAVPVRRLSQCEDHRDVWSSIRRRQVSELTRSKTESRDRRALTFYGPLEFLERALSGFGFERDLSDILMMEQSQLFDLIGELKLMA
jgi:hypothetical protein